MNFAITFHTQDAADKPLGGCLLDAKSPNGDWQQITNDCGDRLTWLQPGDYILTISKPGYDTRVIPMHFDLQPDKPVLIGLQPDSNWTPERLRAIKGFIWPARAPLPFGPRPGQPDNIINTGCMGYSPSQLDMARTALRTRGVTHVDVGPFIDPGYHGQYPSIDFRNNPDQVLEWIEGWWAAGFAVVSFIGPDGWTTEQMQSLEPIFFQPRWQAAMRQIVPMGWEPGKDTPNSEFVKRYQWAKRVFPNALQYIHLCADFDAPGNNDDLTPGQSKYIGMAECWNRVVPYLTGYLIQNGPYGEYPKDNPTLAKNFGDQFRADVKGSLRDRFVNGYAGWPTCDLDLIAAEETSFYAYWNNLPEAVSRAWGALAMSAGADGYFDGGE